MRREKLGGYKADLIKPVKEIRDEQVAYLKGYDRGYSEHSPEDIELAKVLIESIDTKQLVDVFHEYLLKSGVHPQNANTKVLEKVVVRPMHIDTLIAYFDPFMNEIILSSTEKEFMQAKTFSDRGEDIPNDLFMKFQLFLIHEACHAFGRNRITTEVLPTLQLSMKTESGYERKENITPVSSSDKAKVRVSLEALNEGITQRIAEEVFLELAQRTGQGGEARKFLSEFITHQAESLWTYSLYGNQVENICEQIALYTGVKDKAAVWDAFKRGYFAKPELFTEEVIELFQETFGTDFLKSYAKIARFDKKSGFSHPKEYAQKWLEQLGISTENESNNTKNT
jgi:hypothetical protein